MMVTITILAVIMGLICGYSWKEMSAAGEEKVRKSASVMMLLLVIGMMLAAFMYSGTLPMVLYYGIKLVNPSWLALSGRSASSSPQGAPISYLMFAVAPLEGWFLAANLTPVGWFHTQGLKINRTTAMYTQKNLFPNNPP